MRDGKMHQTTVRFSSDLWEALEAECSLLGVSIAQYLREAALARIAYSAGLKGDIAYETALSSAGVQVTADARAAGPEHALRADARAALRDASGNELAANAVGAQSELVLARARELRRRSAELRRARRVGNR